MGMTITEKILAHHAGATGVEPNDLISVSPDLVLSNDVSAPMAIAEMKKIRNCAVHDKASIVMVMDHFTPCANTKAANNCKLCRDFARENGIENFFDVGSMGVEHALLPEQGLVSPGDLIIGGDSHTCTYGALGAFSTGVGSTDIAACMATGNVWLKVPANIKFIYTGTMREFVTGKDLILATIKKTGVDGCLYKAMEFTGEAIDRLSLDERYTMCNMAIEAGAKNGIIAPDQITREFAEIACKRAPRYYASDADATYEDCVEISVSDLAPQVAFPHLPENGRDVGEGSAISIDQVVIGSCTNGRLSDLRLAAKILKGKKVHPYVRAIVIPATQQIYRDAMDEGLITTFLEAGAAVSTPTCGPCFGGHMGTLAAGERCVSTTNRNFIGRMGDPASEVYLANPAVAAASAVRGRIADPSEVFHE